MNTFDGASQVDYEEEDNDAEEEFKDGRGPRLTENAEKVEIAYDMTIWFLIDNLSIDHHMPIEDK